jgi:hypothetical protein
MREESPDQSPQRVKKVRNVAGLKTLALISPRLAY